MVDRLAPGRRRLYGLVALLALAALLAAAIGSYRQVFTSAVMVTVRTDRAGLLMNPGNDMEVRGIKVGEVREVSKTANGAALEVALQPEMTDRIPADATAQIVPNTVFGPKSVQFNVPSGEITNPVDEGDVLRAADVTPEINSIFAVLQEVLTTVDPAKLNATLGAVADALQGRGAQLGRLLSQLEGYLQRFNPHLEAARSDVELSGDVLDTYAEVAPEVLETADNVTTTSTTVFELRGPLHTTLRSLTRTAMTGRGFLDRLEEPLVTALAVLEPTARLLAEYAPEFTCSIKGVNETRRRLESVFAEKGPWLDAEMAIVPGQNGYQYPRDLPTFVADEGPDCYALPYVSRDEVPAPRVRFDDGTNAVFSRGPDAARVGNPPVTFYEQLFGEFGADVLRNLTGRGGDE